jgi:hypothetical protein
MTPGSDELQGHENFKELCAMSVAGNLTENESAELGAHMEACEECRAVYQEYRVLAKEGMPMLAARFDRPEQARGWDDSNTRQKVFDRIATEQRQRAVAHVEARVVPLRNVRAPRRVALPPALKIAAAACFVVAVGLAAYRAGRNAETPTKQPDPSGEARFLKLANEKQTVDNLLSADDLKLRQLQAEIAKKQAELEKLRAELRTLEERSSEVAAAKNNSDEQVESVSQERDTLSKKLGDAQQAYQGIQVELTNLKTERDQATMRSVALQKQVDVLAAENRDQQRKLGNQDQYLSADRDIRELMGARHLYIADVFDVSSDSRTRKPYGRVFYTKGKSLIFYAFDLDRQPSVKNASTFQVWGRNESAQDKPVNLGVLFVDNEANRRWALRCDDPEQLAEIDAVFVTVEPNAHGNRPTGKPFLYASLRKEPNHP